MPPNLQEFLEGFFMTIFKENLSKNHKTFCSGSSDASERLMPLNLQKLLEGFFMAILRKIH